MDKTLAPIHPGEILLEDFMKPLGLSQYRLAHDIGVTPIRISQIVRGERSITVDTAMRLARYFGTSAAVYSCFPQATPAGVHAQAESCSNAKFTPARPQQSLFDMWRIWGIIRIESSLYQSGAI